MRILYLTTSPQLAGAEKTLLTLAIAMKKSGAEILVITLKSEQDGPLLEKLRQHGIDTRSLGMKHKWEFWRVFSLIKIIHQSHPDILQSFLFFDNLLARVFGYFLRVPIIISGQRNAHSSSLIRRVLDKLTLPFATHVVTNSKAGARMLERDYHLSKDNVSIIPNGIPLPIKESSQVSSLRESTHGKFHIGFVGFLTKQKNLDALVRAVSQVNTPIHCTVIGDGPERQKLERLVKELGQEDRISLLGHREQGAGYMRAFDAFVLPSLWEGMPNVVMEAMAQGVPVIATDVGGVGEIIGDSRAGILISPNNIQALAQAAESLAGMRNDERQAMGERGAKRISDAFSQDVMVEAFETLYRTL